MELLIHSASFSNADRRVGYDYNETQPFDEQNECKPHVRPRRGAIAWRSREVIAIAVASAQLARVHRVPMRVRRARRSRMRRSWLGQPRGRLSWLHAPKA